MSVRAACWAVFVVGVMAAAAKGQNEPAWVKLTSKDAGFSASFPVKPDRSERKSNLESIVRDVRYTSKQDGVDFDVGCLDYSAKVAANIKEEGPAAFIKRHRELVVKGTKGKVLSQKDVTAGKAKHLGYELVIEFGPTSFLRQRVVYANGRLYQIMTAGSTLDKVTNARANRFNESFEILE